MSGTLRYLDAERNNDDLRVRTDAYLNSLELAKQEAKVHVPVLPGAVVAAPTTALKKQGVKYIFHMAVVQGEIEVGYRANENAIESGIHNSFRRFRELNQHEPLKSILFPVFGGGTGRLGADKIAQHIIAAVQTDLEFYPEVEQVVLFAHVEAHRRALREAAAAAGWKEDS